MDLTKLAEIFSTLAPPVASLVVTAIVCGFLVKILFKVLDLFVKHGEALKTINDNMSAHTDSIKEMSRNVSANTAQTERVIDILRNKR